MGLGVMTVPGTRLYIDRFLKKTSHIQFVLIDSWSWAHGSELNLLSRLGAMGLALSAGPRLSLAASCLFTFTCVAYLFSNVFCSGLKVDPENHIMPGTMESFIVVFYYFIFLYATFHTLGI